jgi:hypothetical protein
LYYLRSYIYPLNVVANYITEEVLSEAYTRLDIGIYKDKQALEKLKREITSFYEERARFLFGDDIKITIEFEEGSLITRLKVVGNAALIIGTAISAYGSFRSAVDYLAKDSTALAQSANLEVVFRTRAAHCDRVAVEKRQGVFGRANELIKELEVMRRGIASSDLPTSSTDLADFNQEVKRLSEWHKKNDKLFNKIDNPETKACIAAGVLEELERFPEKAPWDEALQKHSFKTSVIKADPELAGRISAAAKQFEVTTKYIKTYYEDLIKLYAPQKA